MAELDTLRENWNEAGRRDPFWAIRSDPGKEGGRWDVGEFFASGRAEIAAVLAYAESIGLSPKQGRALDFGCGVGRLTQALAETFEAVDGVDIAASMVAKARARNRFGSRCRYHVNPAADLGLFDGDRFDFVYSSAVLQHMKPELAKGYLRELVRVLAPGGVAVLQVPSEPRPGAEPDAGRQTRGDEPLPDGAFRARLTPDRNEVALIAGSRFGLGVRVANESSAAWPALGSPDGRHRINLGNHWLTNRGRELTLDDARCSLEADLLPGHETVLSLVVTAPASPGKYVLELDMVQEAVTWFAMKGSPTAHVRVRTHGWGSLRSRLDWALRRIRSDPGPPWIPPYLAMYAVPRGEVVSVLTSCGGTVVDVIEDGTAGEEWLSYRYAVTKP